VPVVFTDDDWEFIEAIFLRGPKYKDPLVRAYGSDTVRRRIDRLVNWVFPRYAEREKHHVSADQENTARKRVVSDLTDIRHIIERWKNVKGAGFFLALTELEVEREIEAPHEFLKVDDNCTPSGFLRAVREQQPGNFDGFRFQPGTLLDLVKRYQSAVKRADQHRIDQKARRARPLRPETFVYELFACQLAELWEELRGEPPKISNNAGFMRTINYVYDLIGRPNRGAVSLKKDLEGYFLTRPTKPP